MEAWFNSLGSLFSIAAVIGNGFVAILITKRRRLHSSANWLVLSLAVADCAVGVVIFPIGYLCSNLTDCNSRVHMAFYWFFVHSSTSNLCALTWDRYTAIVYPLRYLSCVTARRPGIAILLAWLISLAISTILMVGMYTTNSETAWKVLRLAGVTTFDILACVSIIYGVSRILLVVREKVKENSSINETRNRIQSPQGQSVPSESSTGCQLPCRRKKNSVASYLVAIVTFFLVCHVGISYIILRIMFCSDLSDIYGKVLTLLLVVNSTANPFVYAFLKPDIKRELNEIICDRKRINYEGNIEE